MKLHKIAFLFAPTLLLTSGCLEAGEEFDFTETSTGSEATRNTATTATTSEEFVNEPVEELTDVVDPAAGPEYEFSWSQGQSPVPMGSSADRVCFLTRVTGKFEGSGERVHAYVANNTWYLGGNSYQSGVGASARCLSTAGTGGFTSEVTWNQGDYPKSLGASSDRVCFLTRMQGKFMGSGERIHVYGSEGTWYLGGNSYQSGVSASARCIKSVSYSKEYLWTQGNLATLMGGTSVQACFLNKITGKFRGTGENVRTYKSGDSWYLSGNSFQSGVGARGRCVFK